MYLSPVLYGLGTIISLAGTGFLIGVCITCVLKKEVWLMSSCPVLQTNQTRVFCIIISSILCLIIAPQMFKPVRIIATIVFLGSIALVFVGAFVIKNDVRIFFVSHTPHVTHHPFTAPLHK